MKRLLPAILCCLAAAAANAEQKIVLLATMGSKAIVTIDGGRRTLAVGEQAGGVKLLRIEPDGGVFEIDGKQRRLALGEGYVASGGGAQGGGGGTLFLAPDARGHYYSAITINGRGTRGVIDTGASHLSMNVAQARQFDVDYTIGQSVFLRTANGDIKAWQVRLAQVKLGEVTVYDVPLIVRDSADSAPILIGASLLARFQMKQEQNAMVLTKKN